MNFSTLRNILKYILRLKSPKKKKRKDSLVLAGVSITSRKKPSGQEVSKEIASQTFKIMML